MFLQLSKLTLDDLKVKKNVVTTSTPQQVNWEKPPVSWLKLNVDGSCHGNPGSTGGGVVIRD